MIRVVYHREYHRLTIEGHAQSGEPGHDLVCASASILAYTLAASVNDLVANGQAGDPIMELYGGNATVSCKPAHRLKAVVTMIFDSICTGYALLAATHPENISFEVRG